MARGDNIQLGNKALSARRRENCLRIASAARANLDIAARHNNAGRIITRRATRKGCSQSARCGMARREPTSCRQRGGAAHGNTPRRHGLQAKTTLR